MRKQTNHIHTQSYTKYIYTAKYEHTHTDTHTHTHRHTHTHTQIDTHTHKLTHTPTVTRLFIRNDFIRNLGLQRPNN